MSRESRSTRTILNSDFIRTRFRVQRDECNDPIIKCRHGFVYEQGDQTLGVYLETRRPEQTFKALAKKWPSLQKHQVGDFELTVIFKPTQAGESARFLRSIGAHRVREYSVETRQRLSEQGRRLQKMNENSSTGGTRQ